jgi:arylsulfatase A-like enzyme
MATATTPDPRHPFLRRVLLPGLATVVVAVAATCGVAALHHADRQTTAGVDDPRPNFLYINLDDARFEDFKHMPYVRKLVTEKGVEVTNMIAPTPICAPSRASALTGKLSRNNGQFTMGGSHGSAKAFASSGANRETVAVWLDRAGYDTFMTGKWMNGYEENLPDGFSEPGWDKWNPATIATYNFYSTKFFTGTGKQGDGRYNTYQITDRSVDWIRAKRNDEDPWFSWINYVGPHLGGPTEADDPRGFLTTARAPEDRGTFRTLPLPDTPDMFHGAANTFADKQTSRATRNNERIANSQRVEAVQSIDRGVRRQVEALRATGQLANTFVIVTSDNGYELGEHNHNGKLLPYHGSLTVPTSVRGPGIPAGSVARSAVMVPDIPVTLATLAGAAPDTNAVDGMNVIDVLRGRTVGARPLPVTAWKMAATDPDRPLYKGLSYNTWLLVLRGKKSELYNRATDPYQLKNLFDVPAYADERLTLIRMEKALRTCSGNTCSKKYAAPVM